MLKHPYRYPTIRLLIGPVRPVLPFRPFRPFRPGWPRDEFWYRNKYFQLCCPVWSYFPHPFTGLAIFDNLCLTSTFFHDGLHYWFVGSSKTIDDAVFWPVTWPIYKFAFTGNAYMTVLVCVERFVFVVYPFKSKIWCSKKRTLIYICVGTVISFILTIPHFFVFTWDNDGKVILTYFGLKYGPMGGIDDTIRCFLPPVILITLSTIVAIKVSSIQDIRLGYINDLQFLWSFLTPHPLILDGNKFWKAWNWTQIYKNNLKILAVSLVSGAFLWWKKYPILLVTRFLPLKWGFGLLRYRPFWVLVLVSNLN